MHRISENPVLERVETPQPGLERIDSLTLDAEPLADRADRALPMLASPEPTHQRIIWLGAMLVVVALYAFAVFTFWAPADGGIDQNAYLVGGKQLALTGSTGVRPSNLFQYVGHMFIVPEKGDGFYPKYPFGLPLLYAAVIRCVGWARGVTLAFAVSPTCAVLAMAGMFFLARAVAGSFAGMLAALALAGSEVMWKLANVANSHASCVAFVVWGMYFLVNWWNRGSAWRGLLAGFLLGFACLIRYTEGLLILPIALAVVFRIRWRNWRSYLRSATPILGWLIPVAALVIFNRITIGDWTGYDSSNESEFGKAFTWDKFTDTWELMLRTFHDQGLFFVVPLGIAGLVMLFGKSWKLALVVLAWLVPGTMLYTSYYWSPDRGVSYARFFLTFFPALLLGLAVCVRYGIMSGVEEGTRAVRIAKPLAAGLVVAIAAGVGTWRVLQSDLTDGPRGGGGMGGTLPMQFRARLSLATVGQILRHYIPDDSVVFGDEGKFFDQPLNYLQFAGRWNLYSIDAFQNRGLRGLRMGPGGGNGDNPNPMQPRRRERMSELYRGKSERALIDEQQRVTDEALGAQRRVFLFGSPGNVESVKKKFFPPDRYRLITVQRWKDVPEPREWNEAGQVLDNSRRRNRFGGPGGPGGPGRGGGGGGFLPMDDLGNSSWILIEVQRVPPASEARAD
jgi:hypothetical protein